MSISFVIYSDTGKLVSRHTVKDLAEKKSVVAAARKTYGKGLKVRKESARDYANVTGSTIEVEVKVTLQLDADTPPPADKIKLAAKQAVTNALQFAYDNGFDHCLADDVSIGVADVEVIGASVSCARCGCNLDSRGRCPDHTCPFSDHKQNCPAGWTGHPEHKAGRCNCNPMRGRKK